MTTDFSSFALTPNQLASANLLDAAQLNPRGAELITFLNQEPFANLPADLDKISPDGLTAFYEIGFSNSNLQRLNLEDRLDQIRSGSSGFSSNMKLGGVSVNLEAGAPADGKSSKAPLEPVLQPARENRWGVWVTGFGDPARALLYGEPGCGKSTLALKFVWQTQGAFDAVVFQLCGQRPVAEIAAELATKSCARLL